MPEKNKPNVNSKKEKLSNPFKNKRKPREPLTRLPKSKKLRQAKKPLNKKQTRLPPPNPLLEAKSEENY
jgi:hypothetical protein